MIEATIRKDLDAVLATFAEDSCFAQPFNPTQPGLLFKGKKEIRAGFQQIFAFIKRINYLDSRYTVSDDGTTIFLETQGDMVLAGRNLEYKNFYIFRFDFNCEGQIKLLTEYMNSLYLSQILNPPSRG